MRSRRAARQRENERRIIPGSPRATARAGVIHAFHHAFFRAFFDAFFASVEMAAVAVAVAVALLTLPSPAFAQQTTGSIFGRVTDLGGGQPLSGITVIIQGPQGEDAALSDERGGYSFVNLPVGTYVVRFYNATSTTKVERADLAVTAGATLRVDGAIPSQTVVEETYVIRKKAAVVDVGTAQVGVTFDEEYMRNVPLDLTFGDLVLKAPGAFLESSGGVSIAGASGLENSYIVNGLNVTGMELGDIMNKQPGASGGSNLTLDFIQELQVLSGGYRAEFGGAMGGVVNAVTKSGSNELHGSAFLYWSPYWLSGTPKLVLKQSSALVGVDKPDYDTNVGFEVGGPIIKNRLFFWAGFAPRFERTHFFRDVQALVDADHDGVQDVDSKGNPVTQLLERTRTRELRQSYEYGVKLDFLPAPDHRLSASLFGTPTAAEHVRENTDEGAATNDPRWALQGLHKTNTDVTLNYVGQVWDRRLRIDAGLGLHREVFRDESPYAALNSTNFMEWHNASLYNLEPNLPGCQPVVDAATNYNWDPCPVDNYHNGGYGQVKVFTGNRWMGDLKGTLLLPRNEIKAGIHTELSTFDQTRYYSGPIGGRALIQNYPGQTNIYSFFTLPRGTYASQFADGSPPANPDPNMDGALTDLGDPNNPNHFYQDQLVANVKNLSTAYFLQDSIHPISNLTIDAGLRLENQRVYDFRGAEFLNLYNFGPRLGAVYDPTDDGQSKIYAHYGQFYEAIPMNLAARYFGGEGILVRTYDSTTCSPPPSSWKGTGGEWASSNCSLVGVTPFNAGAPYPVQADIHGQYHSEIVAGARRALPFDLVVGIDFTRRWLGTIVEDGTADGQTYAFVLGNPGAVPQSALNDVTDQIAATQRTLDASSDGKQRAIYTAQIADLNSKLKNLKALGSYPKPERTYDAITLSAQKRIARNWMVSASYTYSRLIGNYNGLYDADDAYFAPNGSNFYDTPDLVLNRKGPLANDHPHSGRVDGFYRVGLGQGLLIVGLSWSVQSGTPRNYVAQWIGGTQDVFLLPRGAAGRTPTVTQTDGKIGYHRDLSKTTAMEVFLDLYNLFDERTALQTDDNYTFDQSAPIVNGSVNDLKYAKNLAGTPIAVNPNFGKGTVFQQPIHGRIGLRFLF